MKRRINFYLLFGVILTALMVALIVMGFFYTPYDPDAMSGADKFAAPSLTHWMGADQFGRDVFSRVLRGAGTTLTIALATVAIGGVAGTVIGALTGYFGGWVDEIVMRINDALAAFPSILLALVVIAVAGPGKYNIILALGVLFIPSFARLVRSEVIHYKDRDFVRSARLMGASHLRIIFVHILPNLLPVMLSGLTIGFNNAVLAEASMSYLGIGVQPPDASLGSMLSEAQSYLFTAPWDAIFPGLTIVLLILGMGLIGEGIRERMGEDQ